MAQFTELQVQTALKVGPQKAANSALVTARGDNTGCAVVTEGHGKYWEAVKTGNVYGIANQAPVTTTAVLTSTYTGLGVGNPLNSGKYLNILMAGFSQHAVAAAGTVGLITNTQVIAASLVPKNKLTGVVGGSVAVASASFSLTGTAVLEFVIGSTGSLATTGWGNLPAPTLYLDGLLALAPGNAVSFYTTVVTTTALIFSIAWEEIDI